MAITENMFLSKSPAEISFIMSAPLLILFSAMEDLLVSIEIKMFGNSFFIEANNGFILLHYSSFVISFAPGFED